MFWGFVIVYLIGCFLVHLFVSKGLDVAKEHLKTDDASLFFVFIFVFLWPLSVSVLFLMQIRHVLSGETTEELMEKIKKEQEEIKKEDKENKRV